MSSFENYDPLHLDHYDYKLELKGISGVIRRALWFSAGGDIKLLERCPHSERVKYEGLGGVVMATAILAFFSGFFAMYTVFGPIQSIATTQDLDTVAVVKSLVVATIWALIIFNLDRFIITSTGHGDGTEEIAAKELFQGLPRIIMAIVIGLSISAPLEIRVMKTEIDAQLLKDQRVYVEEETPKKVKEFEEEAKRVELEKNEVTTELQKNTNDVDALTQAITKLENEIANEINTGVGPKFKVRNNSLLAKKNERTEFINNTASRVQELKIKFDKLNDQKTDLNNKKEIKIQEIIQESLRQDGIATRIKAAHEISPTVSLALTLLLVVIEITPIFIKMMLIRGPYDYLTDNQNQIILAKYAIETRLKDHAGDNTNHSIEDVYHQAKNIENHVIGNLIVENQLAEQAREIFLNTVKADMRAEPEKYMPDLNKPKA